MRALALTLTFAMLATSCATSSSLTVPGCAERLEVEGQHERRGGRLVFDHSLDPPWAVTEIVLQRDGQQETLRAAHLRPDGGRLLVASVFGVVGTGLLAIAGYEVINSGQSIVDDGPFYAGVFGVSGIALATLLGLTGWQPVFPADIGRFCGPDD